MFHRYAQELGTALKKIIVNPQYNDDAVIAAQIFRAVPLSPEWIPDLISLLGSQDLSQREAAKIVLLMLDRVPAELELQLVELALGPHLSNEAYIVLQKIATTLTEASILRIASVVHESGHPAGRQAKFLLVRVPKGKKPSEAQIQAFVQSCTNADRTKP